MPLARARSTARVGARISARIVAPILLILAALPAQSVVELTGGSGEAQQRRTVVPGDDGLATCWLPDGADAWIVPFAAGVEVRADDDAATRWLRNGSPWNLLELPLLGARYGDRTLAVIVPWPHYAELVTGDRVGIRFRMPEGRHDAAPCVVLTQWTDNAPLAIAHVFRAWRATAPAAELGMVPKPVSLADKITNQPRIGRLLGAPHVYLWGSARFSHHDVPRQKWRAVAGALRAAGEDSPLGKLRSTFSDDERDAVKQLADVEWPEAWLLRIVAPAIDRALRDPATKTALLREFGELLRRPETWGDGISATMLTALHDAGIDRALLLTSDLHQDEVRPDVIAHAEELGYLFGPYDSYHSVHSPNAGPDSTWETAQFDAAAFENGRVLNADGSGHGGFRGRGFHFAPASARPYVHARVDGMCEEAPFSAWFIDCDATGEAFEDYHPDHPATRIDDTRQRRDRLQWLADEHDLVVGSEGGSILFADVIAFGHGVDTPYIGHLDPALRDRESEHFLGRHWPPDTPEQSFDPVPIPASLRVPYFDPSRRIPLYRAAIGDELVTSHHWSFDSLKLSNVRGDRELLELLTMTPPMYHLSRAAWPLRLAAIRKRFAFWSPLHRVLATAPLVDFRHLTADRLVQRATYRTAAGDVHVTVNFATETVIEQGPRSVVVTGAIADAPRTYRVE